MSKTRSVYWDPEGSRYGIPTYPWQCAPSGLATRRQLAAKGLRPGGQPVVAQVMWHSSRCPSQHDVAYLYRVDLAKPKRVPTAAQLRALDKALAARRMCPECDRDAGYVISTRLGICNRCAEAAYNEPRTCRECGRVQNYVIPAVACGTCVDCLSGRTVSHDAVRTGPADYADAERVCL